jgi:hypothetical protein
MVARSASPTISSALWREADELLSALTPLATGTLRLWRVSRSPVCWDPIDGAGRWSLEGDCAIYASCSAGLAVLEALVRLKPSAARSTHRLATLQVRVRDGEAEWLDPSLLSSR